MPAIPNHELYKYRLENSRAIEEAIRLIEVQIKNLIKKGINNDETIVRQIEKEAYVYNCLLANTIIVWGESQIHKTMLEHEAFTEEEVIHLFKIKDLSRKWKIAFTYAFKKQCLALQKIERNDFTLIPHNESTNDEEIFNGMLVDRISNDPSIPEADIVKFKKLLGFFDIIFSPMKGVRNYISHGQWVHVFNKYKYNVLDTNASRDLEKINILYLKLFFKQFKAVIELINDLAKFKCYTKYRVKDEPPPFLQKFSKKIDKLDKLKYIKDNCNYDQYKKELFERYDRGIHHKKRNEDEFIKSMGEIQSVKAAPSD
jgi:hypothetical protein